MLSIHHIFDTIDMIDKRHLDIRTITMGISLLDCVSEDPKRCCEKIYDKICRRAQHLVRTGEEIQGEFGIPIVNKRISVTPMALVAGGCDTEDYVPFAHAMDRAAKTCGVDFIGGYSALVQKGFAHGDELLLRAIPQALAETDIVCSSINVGSKMCIRDRAQRDQRLREGDVLQLYINDEFFDKPREDNLFLTLFRPSLDIVYEDENLMLLNKRPGLVVHADETEKVNTLINHIQAYLYQKREWNPRWENAFTPCLLYTSCTRCSPQI